jgi:dihydrofolate reductase
VAKHVGRYVESDGKKGERDISVGGPELAAQAIRAGLVDEIHLYLSPIVVGGGTRALPDGARVMLELLAERRFGNGVGTSDTASRTSGSRAGRCDCPADVPP